MFKVIIMIADGLAIVMMTIILAKEWHSFHPVAILIVLGLIVLAASNIFLLGRGQKAVNVLDYLRSLIELKTLKNQKEIERIKNGGAT